MFVSRGPASKICVLGASRETERRAVSVMVPSLELTQDRARSVRGGHRRGENTLVWYLQCFYVWSLRSSREPLRSPVSPRVPLLRGDLFVPESQQRRLWVLVLAVAPASEFAPGGHGLRHGPDTVWSCLRPACGRGRAGLSSLWGRGADAPVSSTARVNCSMTSFLFCLVPTRLPQARDPLGDAAPSWTSCR